jgi:hypothetical protein
VDTTTSPSLTLAQPYLAPPPLFWPKHHQYPPPRNTLTPNTHARDTTGQEA